MASVSLEERYLFHTSCMAIPFYVLFFVLQDRILVFSPKPETKLQVFVSVVLKTKNREETHLFSKKIMEQ